MTTTASKVAVNRKMKEYYPKIKKKKEYYEEK